MPTKGDRLYRYGRDGLEVVTFLSEGLADASCTIPSWRCRDAGGRRFRCAVDSYATTEREAVERYLVMLQAAVGPQVNAVETAKQRLDELRKEIADTQRRLKTLSPSRCCGSCKYAVAANYVAGMFHCAMPLPFYVREKSAAYVQAEDGRDCPCYVCGGGEADVSAS